MIDEDLFDAEKLVARLEEAAHVSNAAWQPSMPDFKSGKSKHPSILLLQHIFHRTQKPEQQDVVECVGACFAPGPAATRGQSTV